MRHERKYISLWDTWSVVNRLLQNVYCTKYDFVINHSITHHNEVGCMLSYGSVILCHVYKSIMVTSNTETVNPTQLVGGRGRQLREGECSVEGRERWKRAKPIG